MDAERWTKGLIVNMNNAKGQTMESLHELIKEVLLHWCEPRLLKKNFYGDKPQPVITYELCKNSEDHIVIRIIVRSGPFGTEINTSERIHYSIEYIDWFVIEGQLLNALTFKSSPFYLLKLTDSKTNQPIHRTFDKRMEVYG